MTIKYIHTSATEIFYLPWFDNDLARSRRQLNKKKKKTTPMFIVFFPWTRSRQNYIEPKVLQDASAQLR